MAREQHSVDQIVSLKLPGFGRLGAGHGEWRSPVGTARWSLEPDDDGFWLVLDGAFRADARLLRASRSIDLIAASRRWPWPFKAVGRRSGDGRAWCAELWLDGRSQDDVRVQHLVDRLHDWLSDESRGGRRPPVHSDESGSIEPGADLLFEAFGDELRQSREGFRLSLPDGPALEIRSTCEGDGALWQVLGVLARSRAPLPSPAIESVRDYLRAANARFRGCRAFLDPDQENAACIEGRLPETATSAETVREAVAAVAAASRLIAAACRVLYEVPKIGEAYVRYFLEAEVVRDVNR
jgi:hypothetical protein